MAGIRRDMKMEWEIERSNLLVVKSEIENKAEAIRKNESLSEIHRVMNSEQLGRVVKSINDFIETTDSYFKMREDLNTVIKYTVLTYKVFED